MRPTVPRRGLVLVLSSPYGADKSTIARALLERDPDIIKPVSCTTRPPRLGEVDGKDYHFVGVEKFQQMVEGGEFLEHVRVFGNFYGTPRGPVEDTLSSGRDVLFDIDWQGIRQLDQNDRPDLVTVFILPPSVEELGHRRRPRAQDSDEMSHGLEYDYILLDTEAERSIARVQAILDAERQTRPPDRHCALRQPLMRPIGVARPQGLSIWRSRPNDWCSSVCLGMMAQGA